MEAPVSYLEQSRSLQPSIVLQLVLLLSSCVEIIQLQTIWPYRSNTVQHAYLSVHVTIIVLKALALLLGTFVKGTLDPACRRQHSPEDFSGLFGLETFGWLNPLLFTGYRKCLVASDLYPLPSPLTADRLLPRNSAANQRWSTTIMASSLPAQAIVTMIPHALVPVFSFAQVFLLQAVLRHLQHMDEQTSSSVSHVLVLVTFLVYAAMALSTAWYWRANEKTLLMGGSLLMGILYSQTMMGSVANTTDTEVVTLVGTKLERIRQGFERLHDLWCCPIEATVAVWLLFRQLGPFAMAPIAAVVSVALCTTAIGKAIPESQRAWLTARQERVSFTADAVKNLEALQIANLPRAVKTLLRNMRNRDISMGQRFRLQQLSIIIIILAYVPTHVSPVLAFAFINATINVTTLFPSIALIMLLSKPLETLIQTFPPFLTSLACFGRIRKYLSKGRCENTRPLQAAARDHSRVGIAIEMKGCNFGWSPERPVLRDVNALIPIHSFTVVSGPNGSGKSILCKALIGEIPITSGHLQLLGTTSDPIGFCYQQPFLLNTIIQRNITGLLPFDRRTYQKVLEVVMLVDDLQQMECGDHTEVCSHGSNLSGGQKQRIALARALYARPSLYVLDDVFTGLDATMAQQIFDNTLGPMGWIKSHGGTVFFASNDLNIESADYNIILDCNGRCRIEERCGFDYETTPTKGGPVESISIATATALLANAEDHSTCSSTDSFTEASHEGDIEKASPTVFANADGTLDETTMQFESNSRHYNYYLKASRRMAFLLFACLASFHAFFNMSTVWISFWTSDRFHQPRSVYLGAYGFLQALTLIFQ